MQAKTHSNANLACSLLRQPNTTCWHVTLATQCVTSHIFCAEAEGQLTSRSGSWSKGCLRNCTGRQKCQALEPHHINHIDGVRRLADVRL